MKARIDPPGRVAPVSVAAQIEDKFYVAGQMDAQGSACEKRKIGSGGTILAISRRLRVEARAQLEAALLGPVPVSEGQIDLKEYLKHKLNCRRGQVVEPVPCPTCGERMLRVRNTSGYLNDDQFDAVKAGDWFCKRHEVIVYRWDRDCSKHDCTCGLDAAVAAVGSRLPGPAQGSEDARPDTAAEILLRKLDEWGTHVRGCQADDCAMCEAAMNQVLLAHNVWKGSTHQRPAEDARHGGQPQGWQPISTAPKDRSWFLGWNEDVGCFVWRDGPGLLTGEDPAPTHWMPLPPAPAGA